MVQEKEKQYKNIPWVLMPEDNIKCPVNHIICDNKSRKDKQVCNRNGCPYDLSGDDGMY